MERTLPYIGLLARYPSVGSAILTFFYVFLMRGGGGLQSLPLASSRDGASDLIPYWPSQRAFLRWHAASSRGSQVWPQQLLLEFSCCLHQYGLYMQINGRSFGGKSPHPGLPAYFTLKMDAYASRLAMYLSISRHIHIQAYRNAIIAMTSLDRYSV